MWGTRWPVVLMWVIRRLTRPRGRTRLRVMVGSTRRRLTFSAHGLTIRLAGRGGPALTWHWRWRDLLGRKRQAG